MYTVVDTFTRSFVSMWPSRTMAEAEVEASDSAYEGRYAVEYVGDAPVCPDCGGHEVSDNTQGEPSRYVTYLCDDCGYEWDQEW